MRWAIAVGAVAAVCGGSVPAALGATVTIGPPDVSGGQNAVGVTGPNARSTVAQLTQPTAGVLLTAPADGVITAWHVHGDTDPGGSLALRVLRRSADGLSFTGVATSAAVTAAFGDGGPAHPVSIPVKAGDYIGVDLIVGATTYPSPEVHVDDTLPSGATFGFWGGGLADGSTLAPAATGDARLMLNAVESLPPVVSGLSPSSGSTAGGQAVTITGSNLDGASAVRFGATPAASFTASATQITATAPAHAQGTVDVQVTGPGGVSPVIGADSYSYVRPGVVPPSIVVSSPADGAIYAQGQTVRAVYACAASAGANVSACTGPVANDAPIDTTTLGSHTFTVIAQDSHGSPATTSLSYTVVTALTPTPIVRDASQTAKTWRESNALPHVSAKNKTPVGTTFSFSLNEPATVTLSFTRHAAGRKAHRKCVASSAENRHQPRCARAIAAGSVTLAGRPGANRIRFAGRISATNKLKPGSYTLQITATITQHQHSTPQSLTFTIVK